MRKAHKAKQNTHKKGNRTVPKYIPPVTPIVVILGDPGSVSGGRKKSQWARKNSGEEKTRTLSLVADFTLIFSHPLRLFRAPTNCPWVSEDEYWSKGTKDGLHTSSCLTFNT